MSIPLILKRYAFSEKIPNRANRRLPLCIAFYLPKTNRICSMPCFRPHRGQEFGFDSPYPCSNGQEAIDALKAGLRPDLVITDICMPVAETAWYWPRTFGNICRIPWVVILSGYDDFQYAQQALQAAGLRIYPQTFYA